MKKLLVLICAVTIASNVGCQTLSKTEKVSNSPTPKSSTSNAMASYNPIAKLTGNSLPKGRPDSIVAIWKDATYTVSSTRPTRGFGGRLYFYDREKNPIVVDGELVIYGFKDDKYNPSKTPEKRFIFAREELQSHMSVSAVGPSYNVWLPWDHINGEQKSVTIIAVFKEAGPNGRVCRSESIPALLPGSKPVIEEATSDLIQEIRDREALKNNVQKVGFNETKPEGSKKIKSHEIRIPEGSRQRLFGQVPTNEFRLPEPKIKKPATLSPTTSAPTTSAPTTSANNAQGTITQPQGSFGANATGPTSSPQGQLSAGSSPDQPQARSGQFVRQGKLPPGKQPPRLGAKSSVEVLR